MDTRIYNGYKQFNYGNGWVFTHRAIAQKTLGKPIPQEHEVHHVNRNKLDNRPENLVVLPREEHQKIHNKLRTDKTTSLINIVDNYSDYLLSNLVAKSELILELQVMDITTLHIRMMTIDLEISNIETDIETFKTRKTYNQDIHNRVLKALDLPVRMSTDVMQLDDCYKLIESKISEKELLSQKLEKSEKKLHQQIDTVVDSYTKMAKEITSTYSKLFRI